MKRLFALLVILTIVTAAFAVDWSVPKTYDRKTDGAPNLSIANTGGAGVTKTTLTECFDAVYHTVSGLTAAVDTVVFPKGCIGSNAIWTAECWEDEDSTFAGSLDGCQVSSKVDTLFIKRGAGGTGTDFVFGLRIR